MCRLDDSVDQNEPLPSPHLYVIVAQNWEVVVSKTAWSIIPFRYSSHIGLRKMATVMWILVLTNLMKVFD